MSIVNYNYASHVAANTINRNESIMDKTMARIASGTKVGAGHADSGTYALYTNMTVEGKESRAALVNLNSGLARMKLVESTGMAIHKISIRMQELATTASNTLLPDADRYAMDAEFQALLGEWDRLGEQTRYNGNLIMTGTDLTINMGEAGTAANVTVLVDDWRPDAFVAAGGAYTAGEVATGALVVGAANSAGGATAAMNLTSVVSAGAVPATRQENITSAANAALSRAKLDSITGYLAASVGEVAGDIQSLEFAIEAASGGIVTANSGAADLVLVNGQNAPQIEMRGHHKGILSASWCPFDSNLLISSGKDNRTILWDPDTAEMLCDLPPAANWTFHVSWSPKMVGLVSCASFDGEASVYSLQDAGARLRSLRAPTSTGSGPMRESSTGSSSRPWRAPKRQMPKNCLKKITKMYDLEVESTSTARKVEMAPCTIATPISSSALSVRS